MFADSITKNHSIEDFFPIRVQSNRCTKVVLIANNLHEEIYKLIQIPTNLMKIYSSQYLHLEKYFLVPLMTKSTFIKRKARSEPGFELTKPSTGQELQQDYNTHAPSAQPKPQHKTTQNSKPKRHMIHEEGALSSVAPERSRPNPRQRTSTAPTLQLKGELSAGPATR
jgi:hypothetical protein